MALHLIVDGYNLIGALGGGPLDAVDSLESAREHLIEDLRRYKRIKRARITLVFDSAGSPASPRKETYKGIEVVYALAGEKADDAIVRMVGRSAAGVVVVTSDAELARTCHRLGAATISSPEFRERLISATIMEIKGGDEDDEFDTRDSTEKRGPSRRLPSRLRVDRRRLRKV